jgi:hypothetical protein
MNGGQAIGCTLVKRQLQCSFNLKKRYGRDMFAEQVLCFIGENTGGFTDFFITAAPPG